ncbi:MAG: hypothetical protein N4A33_03185 [Bacteriovoracaceae bacterium]|jgi:hypothetical protein|nr:hypothetical protein [Bacteriovoracaceae bacterium]
MKIMLYINIFILLSFSYGADKDCFVDPAAHLKKIYEIDTYDSILDILYDQECHGRDDGCIDSMNKVIKVKGDISIAKAVEALSYGAKDKVQISKDLEQNIKEQMSSFSKKYGCGGINRVALKVSGLTYGIPRGIQIEATRLSESNPQEYIKMHLEGFFTDKMKSENFYQCHKANGDHREIKSYSKVSPYTVEPRCYAHLKESFKDNSAQLKDSTQLNKLVDCIVNSLEDGTETIDSIVIKSSSSQLRNKGQLCSRDFKTLSKARSLSVLNAIKAKVKDDVVFNVSDNGESIKEDNNGVKVKIYYLGTNGNGTSGPCPYEGNERTNNLRLTMNTDEPALENSKYVKVSVKFKPIVKVSNKYEDVGKRYKLSCSILTFRCDSWPAKAALKPTLRKDDGTKGFMSKYIQANDTLFSKFIKNKDYKKAALVLKSRYGKNGKRISQIEKKLSYLRKDKRSSYSVVMKDVILSDEYKTYCCDNKEWSKIKICDHKQALKNYNDLKSQKRSDNYNYTNLRFCMDSVAARKIEQLMNP